MSQSIHGHEIMRMIHEADPPLSREALQQAVTEQFGADAQFHACAGGGMSLDGILQFLASRGKVVETEGQLRTDIGQMCNHSE